MDTSFNSENGSSSSHHQLQQNPDINEEATQSNLTTNADGTPRIRLACLSCRAKKARCSGEKPNCAQCLKHDITCVWPDGRKRKRTRKEMAEASAAAAAAALAAGEQPPPMKKEYHSDGGADNLYAQVKPKKSTAEKKQNQPLKQLGQPQPQNTQLDSQHPGSSQNNHFYNTNATSNNDSHPSPFSYSSSRPPVDPWAASPSGLSNDHMMNFDSFSNPAMTPSLTSPAMGNNALFNSNQQQPPQQQPQQSHPNLLSSGLTPTPQPNYGMFSSTSTRTPGATSSTSQSSNPPAPQINNIFVPPSPAIQQQYALSLPSTSTSTSTSHVRKDGTDVSGSSNSLVSNRRYSNNNHRLRNDDELMRAVTSQVGYVEGDKGGELRVFYFRVSGATSIHPGINRISLKLNPRNPDTPAGPGSVGASGSGLGGGITASSPTSSSPANAIITDLNNITFDPTTDMPLPSVYLPLVDTFYRTVGQHFPSIVRERIAKRLASGTMSAFLLNAMCAVSARFSPLGKHGPADAGNPFLSKAHELLIPLLRLPTTDGVTGLMLLSWAEFGVNSDSGLWHFAGLAFRMSQDLGLHKNTDELYEDISHFYRTRNLFWSLFITDRLLSLINGRPTSIPDSIIEIPLPALDGSDVPPGPSPPPKDDYNVGGPSKDGPPPAPFAYVVRLMILIGNIGDLLNGSRGAPRTFPSESAQPLAGALSALQTELVKFYSDIPERMKWSVDNFKEQALCERGGIFLFFHFWANAVLALLHHPDILFSPNGTDTPMNRSLGKSIKLSLASSRIICECMVFAELFSPISYLATPMITQPLYIAGLAFIHEIKSTEMGFVASSVEMESTSSLAAASSSASGGPGGPASEAFLVLLSRQNLSTVSRALKKMEEHWAGAGPVLNILQQRASGLTYQNISLPDSGVDTFISMPDSGILRRFKSSGAQTPAEGLSPHAHLESLTAFSPNALNLTGYNGSGSDNGGNDNSWMLENLLNSGYSVDELLVEPAGYGTFDPSFFDQMFSTT